MPKNSYMEKIGKKAKIASFKLSALTIDKKNSVLKQFNQYLKINKKLILSANKKDISYAKSKKIRDSMIDRLKLNNKIWKSYRKSFIFLEKTKWFNY